jgi:hypothetical protein
MAKTKDEQPQQTMEDYLLSQLETPVKLKDGTVAVCTEQAGTKG